jgi:hypothetical protein
MMTDLAAEIVEALDDYRETRAIDAASPEWDRLLAWFRENQSGETAVYAARLDRELARMRSFRRHTRGRFAGQVFGQERVDDDDDAGCG